MVGTGCMQKTMLRKSSGGEVWVEPCLDMIGKMKSSFWLVCEIES